MTLCEKMNAVLAQLRESLAERDELLHDMAVALLTGRNLFILGKPGQAKSAAVRYLADCISDARYFLSQLNKKTDEEALMGRLDLTSLIPGAVPRTVLEQQPAYLSARNQLQKAFDAHAQTPDAKTQYALQAAKESLAAVKDALACLHENRPAILTEGKIPTSDIVFLDEIFKANATVLNALLMALNERIYVNEGVRMDIPTISFFAASNEMPNVHDPEEQAYSPLLDRFDLKVITEYVQDKDARQAILRDKISGSYKTDFSEKITLDELHDMQREVRCVEVPDTLNELMDQIVCTMREKGLPISDRKFFGYAPIVQASAWLDGRTCAELQDLPALKNYLWTAASDILAIESILHEACTDPLGEKINELRNRFFESYSVFENTRDDNAPRSILVLRDAIAVVYRDADALLQKTETADGKARVRELMDEMQKMSDDAHNSTSMTAIPLSEIASLS